MGSFYALGVDGFSMPFVLLTTFLMPFAILASWESVEKRVKEYMIAFLVLETLMIGVFCALDLVLFYLFFEGGLIPMFLIIGIWGGKRRVYASFKFFLYTLVGSLLMLIAILAMYGHAGTTDIAVLLKTDFPKDMQFWLWLAFFASFAVKMPMWPVHTWLPDAHVEAPTGGWVNMVRGLAARAEVPRLLQDALNKLAADNDRWAYTQTLVEKDDKGKVKQETVVRFDPSQPYAQQYRVLKVDGKEPSDSAAANAPAAISPVNTGDKRTMSGTAKMR